MAMATLAGIKGKSAVLADESLVGAAPGCEILCSDTCFLKRMEESGTYLPFILTGEMLLHNLNPYNLSFYMCMENGYDMFIK